MPRPNPDPLAQPPRTRTARIRRPPQHAPATPRTRPATTDPQTDPDPPTARPGSHPPTRPTRRTPTRIRTRRIAHTLLATAYRTVRPRTDPQLLNCPVWGRITRDRD